MHAAEQTNEKGLRGFGPEQEVRGNDSLKRRKNGSGDTSKNTGDDKGPKAVILYVES